MHITSDEIASEKALREFRSLAMRDPIGAAFRVMAIQGKFATVCERCYQNMLGDTDEAFAAHAAEAGHPAVPITRDGDLLYRLPEHSGRVLVHDRRPIAIDEDTQGRAEVAERTCPQRALFTEQEMIDGLEFPATNGQEGRGYYSVEAASEPGAPVDSRTIVDAVNNAARTLADEFSIKLAVESHRFCDLDCAANLQAEYPQFRHHALIIARTAWPPPMTPDGKAIFVDGAYFEDPYCIEADTTTTAVITADVLRDEGFHLTWWQPDTTGWCGHDLILHTMLPGHDDIRPEE